MRLLFSYLFAIMLIGNTYQVIGHPASFEPDEDRPSRLLNQNAYGLDPNETPMKTVDLMNLIPTPSAVSY